MAVQLERVGWEDGTLVTPARVTTSTGTYDVTDAQYSGTTPLSAENLKAMEDNTENAINEGILQSNTYSTTETIIGTWIDGKPIYRKTITGILDGTYVESGYFFTWINSGITNIDNITSKEISVKTTDKISFEGSENLKLDYILTGGFANKVQIGAKSGSIPADSSVIITLEYTKTTD